MPLLDLDTPSAKVAKAQTACVASSSTEFIVLVSPEHRSASKVEVIDLISSAPSAKPTDLLEMSDSE